MKTIRYTFNGKSVEMNWSEENEKIAKTESDRGEYSVVDDERAGTAAEHTTDDVLNTLLGVTV